MHPIVTQELAAQHVSDMQAQASAARRARKARRARRGPIMVIAVAPEIQPCAQLPGPAPDREMVIAKAA
jgi:hypothetical protein